MKLIAMQHIHYGSRGFAPGDTLPNDPKMAKQWIESGAAEFVGEPEVKRPAPSKGGKKREQPVQTTATEGLSDVSE